MPFDSSDITRFSNEAEEEFARDYPCIIDRVALDIVANTSIYTLSDYVIDIRKILWKGKRLSPITHRYYRDYSDQISTSSLPLEYVINNIGQMQIKFFPIPNVSIASIASNLFGSEVPNRVIVEFYRAPDFSTYKIPDFIRNRTLNSYAQRSCYAMEGKLQNLKAARYWAAQWNFLKNQNGILLESLINEPRRLIIGPSGDNSAYYLPQPRLPYDKDAIDVDD